MTSIELSQDEQRSFELEDLKVLLKKLENPEYNIAQEGFKRLDEKDSKMSEAEQKLWDELKDKKAIIELIKGLIEPFNDAIELEIKANGHDVYIKRNGNNFLLMVDDYGFDSYKAFTKYPTEGEIKDSIKEYEKGDIDSIKNGWREEISNAIGYVGSKAIEIANLLDGENDILEDLEKYKGKVNEENTKEYIKKEISRLKNGGEKTTWTTFLHTIVKQSEYSMVLSSGGFIDESMRKIHNNTQDELITEILGTKKEGYGNGYLQGYNNEISNYLVEVNDYETDLKNKSITSLNSKALASYFEYLENRGELNKGKLIQNLGRLNVTHLLEYWKNNPTEAIAKKILEDKGIWSKMEKISQTSTTEEIKLEYSSSTPRGGHISDMDMVCLVNDYISNTKSISSITDKKLLDSVLNRMYIEKTLQETAEGKRITLLRLDQINTEFKGDFDILRKVISLNSSNSISKAGVNSIPETFFREGDEQFTKKKLETLLGYTDNSNTIKAILSRFSNALGSEKIINIISTFEKNLIEKIELYIPRSLLKQDINNSMGADKEAILQLSNASKKTFGANMKALIDTDNKEKGDMKDNSSSNLFGSTNNSKVSFIKDKEINYNQSTDSKEKILKEINSYIEENGVSGIENEVLDLIVRGHFKEIPALEYTLSDYPYLAALAVQMDPSIIKNLPSELRNNKEVIFGFINTPKPWLIKYNIKYIEFGSDLNLLFEIYAQLKKQRGENEVAQILGPMRPKIKNCLQSNMKKNRGNLEYSSLYEKEAKGIIEISGMIKDGIKNTKEAKEKLDTIQIKEEGNLKTILDFLNVKGINIQKTKLEGIITDIVDSPFSDDTFKNLFTSKEDGDTENLITFDQAKTLVIALKEFEIKKAIEKIESRAKSLTSEEEIKSFMVTDKSGKDTISTEIIKYKFDSFIKENKKEDNESEEKYLERLIRLYIVSTKIEDETNKKVLKEILEGYIKIQKTQYDIDNIDTYIAYVKGDISKEEYEEERIDDIGNPEKKDVSKTKTEKENTVNKQKKKETTSNYEYNPESGIFKIQTVNALEIIVVKESEKEKLKNPEARENYVSFYKTLSELGISGLWNYIDKISNAIGTEAGVNNNNGFLNSNEQQIFLNNILLSVGMEYIDKKTNIEEYKNIFKVKNKIQFGDNFKNESKRKGNSKIEEIFLKKFVFNRNTFERSAFEKSIG